MPPLHARVAATHVPSTLTRANRFAAPSQCDGLEACRRKGGETTAKAGADDQRQGRRCAGEQDQAGDEAQQRRADDVDPDGRQGSCAVTRAFVAASTR